MIIFTPVIPTIGYVEQHPLVDDIVDCTSSVYY